METVIYTLIGLAVIGLLLAVSKPKIDEMKEMKKELATIKSQGVIHQGDAESYLGDRYEFLSRILVDLAKRK